MGYPSSPSTLTATTIVDTDHQQTAMKSPEKKKTRRRLSCGTASTSETHDTTTSTSSTEQSTRSEAGSSAASSRWSSLSSPSNHSTEDTSKRCISRLLLEDLQSESDVRVEAALEKLFEILSANSEEPGAVDAGSIVYAMVLPAPALIVEAMDKWQHLSPETSEDIQYYGCLCLTVLVAESSDKSVFVNAAAPICVINAMKIYPDSLEVQGMACNFFKHFFRPPTIMGDLRTFVEELDGLPLVAEAMRKFPEEDILQRHCCGLLDYLALRKKNHPAMIREGLISLVAMALQLHIEDADVRGHAGFFLNRISLRLAYVDAKEENGALVPIVEEDEDDQDQQDREEEEQQRRSSRRRSSRRSSIGSGRSSRPSGRRSSVSSSTKRSSAATHRPSPPPSTTCIQIVEQE